MDSIRVSEAPDPGSIPGEATLIIENVLCIQGKIFDEHNLLVQYLPIWEAL